MVNSALKDKETVQKYSNVGWSQL